MDGQETDLEPDAGLELSDSDLVTAAGIAEMFDLPIETVQSIIAGDIEVPEHLRPVWPKATEVRQVVFRKKDAEEAARRLREAEQARLQAEHDRYMEERQRRLRQEELEREDYLFERRTTLRSAQAEQAATTPTQEGEGASLWRRFIDYLKALIGPKHPVTDEDPAEAFHTDTGTIDVPPAATPAPASEKVPLGARLGRLLRRTPADTDAGEAGEGELVDYTNYRGSNTGLSFEEWNAARRAARDEVDSLQSELRAIDADDPATLTAAEIRRRRKIAVALRKHEAADRRAYEKYLAKKLADEKKQQRTEIRKSREDRMNRWKRDVEAWKGDVKAAKAAGIAPPRKPKKPQLRSTKPDPLDVINAVRAFAIMLDNTAGELEALDVMTREFDGTLIGEAFRRIYYRMSEQNATMVEAFAPEKLFPTEVHRMLQVGANTISYGDALRQAVELMDTANDAKRELRGEIREPLGVTLASLATLFATAKLMMPTFVDMYESLDMPIPPVSAGVLVLSDWMSMFLGAVAAAVVLYTLWWFIHGRTWDRYRTALDAYKLKMPVVGKANQAQETHHVLKVLNAYLRVGSSERDAILDTAQATSNRAVKKHLVQTADLMLQGRRTFADVFDTDLFPTLARSIVATGERSGRLQPTIENLEATYKREAAAELKTAIASARGLAGGVSALVFAVIVTMVTIPPLEMFGATLSYGQ